MRGRNSNRSHIDFGAAFQFTLDDLNQPWRDFIRRAEGGDYQPDMSRTPEMTFSLRIDSRTELLTGGITDKERRARPVGCLPLGER